MQNAKQALEELSQDPVAARLARERADSLKLYEMTLLKAARDGRAEGKAEGKAETLLAVLAARGILVSESARAQIKAQGDLATLERWVVRALSAASVDEVLAA